MSNLKLSLSINDCFYNYDQSFNRLQYFLCIANNITLKELPKNWNIARPDGVVYAVKEPTDDNIKHNILEGYQHFMANYSIRDCIESFAISLDDLYFKSMLNGKSVPSSATLEQVLSSKEKKKKDKFEYEGLSKKIKILETDCNLILSEDDNKIISGLNTIRNCFAHRNGFIGEKDIEKGQTERTIYWHTFKLFLETNFKKRFDLKLGIPVKQESIPCMKIEFKERTFKNGEQIYFTLSEAYEIAMSLQGIARRLIEEVSQKINSEASKDTDDNSQKELEEVQ